MACATKYHNTVDFLLTPKKHSKLPSVCLLNENIFLIDSLAIRNIHIVMIIIMVFHIESFPATDKRYE